MESCLLQWYHCTNLWAILFQIPSRPPSFLQLHMLYPGPNHFLHSFTFPYTRSSTQSLSLHHRPQSHHDRFSSSLPQKHLPSPLPSVLLLFWTHFFSLPQFSISPVFLTTTFQFHQYIFTHIHTHSREYFFRMALLNINGSRTIIYLDSDIGWVSPCFGCIDGPDVLLLRVVMWQMVCCPFGKRWTRKEINLNSKQLWTLHIPTFTNCN